MKTLISSLVVFLLAAAGGPVHAQIYKWVDEAGKTHYSDQAPAGGKKLDTVADRISVYTPDPSLRARGTTDVRTDAVSPYTNCTDIICGQPGGHKTRPYERSGC